MAVTSDDLDDDLDEFSVRSQGAENVRIYRAATARQAAEKCAHDDYGGDPSWQSAYRVRNEDTGQLWDVVVGVVMQPSFIALTATQVPMPAATHVLWGGNVLCEDLRLRSVPRDWPTQQSWISLAAVADGVDVPPDACTACWSKAPGLVAELRQIGKRK